MFTEIRELFANDREAKARGYERGALLASTSRAAAARPARATASSEIEMHFLPDVYVQCDVCGGRRYNRETLEVHYKEKNIYDVLEMTVEEAHGVLLRAFPRSRRKLQTLYDVGLGYVKLGQSSTTLSGGEAQRVKLATELARAATGRDDLHPRRADHGPAQRRMWHKLIDGAANASWTRATPSSSSSTTSTSSRLPTTSSTSAPRAASGGGRIVADRHARGSRRSRGLLYRAVSAEKACGEVRERGFGSPVQGELSALAD